jgi:hypothetical protein
MTISELKLKSNDLEPVRRDRGFTRAGRRRECLLRRRRGSWRIMRGRPKVVEGLSALSTYEIRITPLSADIEVLARRLCVESAMRAR